MVSGLFLLWQMVDVYRIRRLKTAFSKFWPELLVLMMCLWILWRAESATALSSFVLGALVFFATRLRLIRRNFSNFGWVLVGVAFLMLIFTVSSGFRGMIAVFLGRDVSLTTRTEIWERALELKTNPLIGSGFSSTWLTREAAPMVNEWHLAHSHNG